jgi:hypothetical protein
MSRQTIIHEIENAIGHRRLIWVGTRGTDAQPLLCIDQFAGVFGLISPLSVASWPTSSEAYLENISNQRVDLNIYSIDQDNSSHIKQLHKCLQKALKPGTLITAYRPSAFLAAAYYPRREHATYLGMFHGAQSSYEHKPWVETELAANGIITIPWRYFGDDDRTVMLEWMEGRPCVLRANYSDGGAGLTIARPTKDNEIHLPNHGEGFLAVAPLLEPNVPLNVSGCVFPDGTITIRHPSLQLIGISSCTNRPFGYCGNDFASVMNVLGKDRILQLEELTRLTGRWLHTKGYLGAFGVDALLYGNQICLTEINPRFQGSSASAARLASEAGMSDIYLDHLSAFLGLSPQDPVSLWEQACEQAVDKNQLSQIVCYNTGAKQKFRKNCCVPDLDYGEIKGTPENDITVFPEAMLFKIFVNSTVTKTGLSIPDWLATDIFKLTRSLYELVPETEGVASR